MTKIYHGNWSEDRTVYTEANKPGIDGLVEHEFGLHKFGTPIQSFRGWTPQYYFEEAGFKLEAKIDLLRIGKPVKKVKKGAFQVGSEGGFVEITPADEEYGRKSAGTKAILQTPENTILLQNEYDRLNKAETPFIVFRSYRGWPAIWDTVHFYSQGDLKA